MSERMRVLSQFYTQEENSMKKKMMRTVLCTASVVSLLVGCGSAATNPATENVQATETPVEVATEEKEENEAEEEEVVEETTEAASDAMYDGVTILGQSSWIGYAPLYLADKMGFFDNHGADVEVQYFESKTDSKSALAAGRIQGMSTTVDTHVMSRASGMNITMILALDTSDGGDGLSAINEIADVPSLAGHTVALDTSGGASYFWFQYLLQKEGMTLDDVQVVNMSSGDAGAAFVAGEVDAAVTWEPWLSRAKETENGTVLVDSSSTPGVIVDALAMDSDFAAAYPGTLKAIVQGWYDALAYMESNPDEAYKVMMEYTGDETVESLKETMAEVSFYDQAGNEAYFGGEINDIAKMASDLWLEMKLIDAEPDLDSLIDGSFIGGVE